MDQLTAEGESSVIVNLSEAAMHMYTAAIDALPPPDDETFHERTGVVLAGLRKLRAGLTEAAGRNRSTASVIVALSDVRRRYDSLMARAAAAPGAGLGQQLYAARVQARLSAHEVANGAGLRVELIDELEAGEIPTGAEAAKVKALIAALGGVPSADEQPAHDERHIPAADQVEDDGDDDESHDEEPSAEEHSD